MTSDYLPTEKDTARHFTKKKRNSINQSLSKGKMTPAPSVDLDKIFK